MKKKTFCRLVFGAAIVGGLAYLAKKSELFRDDAAAYAPFEPRQEND